MNEIPAPRPIRRRTEHGNGWEDVERRPYRQDARALFRAVSRQVLFCDPRLAGELRYFEVAPGGFTSLERHQHMHAVMIFRGRGHCLVGNEVHEIAAHDLVTVPPLTWHQFRATQGELLGFLCLVDAVRDRPQLATEQDLAELKRNPAVAAFLLGGPVSPA